MYVNRLKMPILIGILLVVALLASACGSGSQAAPAEAQAATVPTQVAVAPTQAPTKVPPSPTPTEVPPTPTEVPPTPAPTKVPPTPAPTEVPPPFAAAVSPVAMNPAMGEINASNGRPKGIQVARGDDPTKTYALFSPGTRNVPPGVPVYVQAGATGLAEGGKLADYAWTLVSAPEGSASTLAKVDKAVPGISLDMATFTPDKEGIYKISVIVTDDKGAESLPGEIDIVAAKYVGNDTCKTCHADQFEGWSQTLHGTAFQEFVNTNTESEYFSAGYGCARCHTVGYYPVAASTGGWWDVFNNVTNSTWPTDTIALNAFNEEEGKDTFHSAFDPKVQAVSNIGCESCHGPGGAHVAAPSVETAPVASAGSSSCDQCHSASGHHTRGNAVANSAHALNAQLGEGSNPSCARCHSPEGFVDTVSGATEVRAVNGDLGCAVCHDPHSEENVFQLRVVNTATVPMSPESASFTVENAGLSAVCMTCHNARRAAATVEDPTATRFTPHASTATEMLAGIGGYDWTVKLQNSYHVNIGQGVINDEHTNQPGNMALTQVNGGQAPGSCVLCHMYQTPGGTWDTTTSMAVPGHQLIGGHTFAMVTEQDGQTVEHTAPCQQCHPGITSFDFTAQADYDGNGKVEGVQTEVAGLRAVLAEAIGAWKDDAGNSIKVSDGSFDTKGVNVTTDIKAAIYNYEFVGTAGATHNFDRSVGLLQVSYAKVTGSDIPNATLLYSTEAFLEVRHTRLRLG
jgi:hypothetical protein